MGSSSPSNLSLLGLYSTDVKDMKGLYPQITPLSLPKNVQNSQRSVGVVTPTFKIDDINFKDMLDPKSDWIQAALARAMEDSIKRITQQAFTTAAETPPQEIPHEIVTGEVVGWRCWVVTRKPSVKSAHIPLLRSVYIDKTWPVDQPLKSDVDVTVHCPMIRPNGIHAFKSQHKAEEYVEMNLCLSKQSDVFVIGTVDMWGQVIQHAHGWRSEFAQIRSLERMDYGDKNHRCYPTLDELRELYGVSA
jgi:hypothetical protein